MTSKIKIVFEKLENLWIINCSWNSTVYEIKKKVKPNVDKDIGYDTFVFNTDVELFKDNDIFKSFVEH